MSRLTSLGFLLSAGFNFMDLLQREYPQILARIGVWYLYKWLGVQNI